MAKELDHNGPVDGMCFMGLNFTWEQMDSIQMSIVECMAGKPTCYAVEHAIVQLIQERNALKAAARQALSPVGHLTPGNIAALTMETAGGK